MNDLEIRFKNVGHRRRHVACKKPADTIQPFAGLLRLLAGKVVEANARMGVEQAEGLVLLLQIDDQPRQHRMLQHVGEIARMVDVAIVHLSS